MDDATITRVLWVFGKTGDLLGLYVQQIEHWRGCAPTAAQRTQIDRVSRQVTLSRETVAMILSLASEIKPQTIEAIQRCSNTELGLGALRRPRRR